MVPQMMDADKPDSYHSMVDHRTDYVLPYICCKWFPQTMDADKPDSYHSMVDHRTDIYLQTGHLLKYTRFIVAKPTNESRHKISNNVVF